MKRNRLIRLIEAFGADPRRWPTREQPAAEAMLRTDPPRQALAEAAALDRLLAKLPEPIFAPELADGILARIAMAAQERRVRAPALRSPLVWANAASLAVSALFGFFLGIYGLEGLDTALAGPTDWLELLPAMPGIEEMDLP